MSNLAVVYPNGKEPATVNAGNDVVSVSGKELAVVAVNGKELAKGGQDLAK